MAYVAVSGGKEAIEESIKLLDYYRSGTDLDIEIEAIMHKMSLLVDRVMSEAGLYSKTYAALTLKQCEGSIEEAVFLLRAYRSTLTRNYYTNIVDTGNMRVVRRISAAFKDIPGGQILGATYDYTHRLINFNIDKEDAAGLRQSMTAVDPDGLVGYVYELGNNSAKIILLTDPLVSISCVNERTGDIYVLTGSTAGRLEIQYATLHSDIAVGDKLLTSGYSYRFRKGIPVATVVSVTLPKNSLAKKATAKPLANITGLDILFLIR